MCLRCSSSLSVPLPHVEFPSVCRLFRRQLFPHTMPPIHLPTSPVLQSVCGDRDEAEAVGEEGQALGSSACSSEQVSHGGGRTDSFLSNGRSMAGLINQTGEVLIERADEEGVRGIGIPPGFKAIGSAEKEKEHKGSRMPREGTRTKRRWTSSTFQ
jgi:hypothetical protein